MQLYQIRRDIETALEEAVVDEETGVMDDTSVAKVSELERVFVEKLKNCAGYVKNCRAEAKALDEEIAVLKARRDALENKAKGVRNYVKGEMKRLGMTKQLAGTHKLSIVNNPKGLDVQDIDALDERWKETVVEVKVKKKYMLKHFRETGEIPAGTEITEGSHLRVT